MKTRLIIAVLMFGPAYMVHAEAAEECCNIVAIDAQAGTVRFTIGDSGRSITLHVGSAELLASMQIGQLLGFEGQDDWESLEEGQNLTPTGVGDRDPDDLEICCEVVDIDTGIAVLATQRIAERVTLEILEMRRINDKVLHLAFAVDNQAASATDLLANGLFRWVGSGPTKQATGIELHDLVGLKKYRAGSASQSRDLDVPPNSRREYWAQYQSPPSEVNALTVAFTDAPPLYDVPIQ